MHGNRLFKKSLRELKAEASGRKAEREVKYKMVQQSSLPVNKSSLTLDIKPSSYYCWLNHSNVDKKDTELRNAIHEIAIEFMGYGYRRITAELHRQRIIVNRKKVLRIMKEENLTCKKKKFKPITTNSNHKYNLYPNLTKCLILTKLNQLWVSDITYIRLGREFVYLATIMDVFSRKCIGWDLSRNINTELTLNALNMAINARTEIGFDELIHHSDRGVQYASIAYVDLLQSLNIRISMSETGNPRENAFAESFFKTLKIEEVYLKEYETYEDVYNNIKEFIEEVYNTKRLHSGIGYVPPNEFEAKTLNISLS